ncbi:MAG: HAD family phosphatase [Phycisphaerae bacterium]|nr:HAD family phosphatase [Saprospiraceae bacterium]
MIRNIIFDFGNVLFDLDLGAFERAMKNLLGEGYATAKEKLSLRGVFELYETGGLSTEEFVENLSQATEPLIPQEQVIAAWNAIFIGMPRHRFEMLLRLRQRYKVFLLSNINDLHERWIADYMGREHELVDYESLHFDGVYFSHLIRLRKPTREAFEYVLADAEILPEETVFFDDLQENVEAARLVGIQGVWHEPGTEIGERLFSLGYLGS